MQVVPDGGPMSSLRSAVAGFGLAAALLTSSGAAHAEFKGDLSNSPLAAAASKGAVNIKISGQPRVVDGDTFAYEPKTGEKTRIRLLGIDAPESRQMCTSAKGTPYACGLESKTYMQDLVKNDPVSCYAAKKDQYGRVLGVCFDEKTGIELNEKMVKEGEAVAYVAYSKAYVDEEAAAVAAKKGVWGGKNFQKPWDYRKQKKAQGAANAQAKRDAVAAKMAASADANGAAGDVEDDAPFEE
jgi:endonuclease YncB( thermonuclease family)